MAGVSQRRSAGLRRLILIRHGAAAAQTATGEDRERALTPEGRRAIAKLAPRLATIGAPDAILCSPARRTRETLTTHRQP